MKKAVLLFNFSFCIFHFSFSQNVVPNGSFEQFSACPNGISQFETNVIGWWNPSTGGANGSPDYFNSCATAIVGVPDNQRGYQFAHTGDAYCGIVIARGNYNQNFREYIEVPFTSTLEADSCYQFEMFFNLANISQFNSDNLYVYFSDTLVTGINNPYPLPFTPHLGNPAGNFPDTVNWSVFSGDYIADGTENYMIIGNFFDSANSTLIPFNNSTGSNVAFVYIDDVSLVKVPCVLDAIFTVSDNTICPGTCTDFNSISIGAASQQWSFPGGNPSVSTDVNPTGICYNSPGNYDVTLIISNGATTDTLTLNNYITVFPFPLPQGILQSGDTLIANQGATSYQWYFNGSIIPGATSYFYVAQMSGDYNVVATDENGCEVEAVINNVIAAVTPLFFEEGSGVRLYPNPVDRELIIKNEELIIETAISISIYNLHGALAFQLPVQITPGTETGVDVSSLTKGMYWLEIIAGEKIYRAKFLKQ